MIKTVKDCLNLLLAMPYAECNQNSSLLQNLAQEKDDGAGKIKARRNAKVKRVDEQSIFGNGDEKAKNSHVLMQNIRMSSEFHTEHSQTLKISTRGCEVFKIS